MRLLLDTHILIWSAFLTNRLSRPARKVVEDPGNEILFSAASLWEVAIKFSLQKKDFPYEPQRLRNALVAMGFEELSIANDHIFAVTQLPLHHHDPFDRLLVAQASVENLTLLTSDKHLVRYGNMVRKV